MRAVLIAGAVAGLAGCVSDGDGDGGLGQAYAARDAAHFATRDEFGAMGSTPDAEVPTQGAATYAGTARAGAGDLILVGNSLVEVNFEAASFEGTAGDFLGRSGSGPVLPFEGSLSIVNGQITGSDVDAIAQGSLEGGGRLFEVDTSIGGDFFGQDDQAAYGLQLQTLSPANASIWLDGVRTGGFVDIVAVR